jgi:hypothetical protein
VFSEKRRATSFGTKSQEGLLRSLCHLKLPNQNKSSATSRQERLSTMFCAFTLGKE